MVRNHGSQELAVAHEGLPVTNRDKRLVGILSLGDVAFAGGSRTAGEALGDISRPGGRHNQTA